MNKKALYADYWYLATLAKLQIPSGINHKYNAVKISQMWPVVPEISEYKQIISLSLYRLKPYFNNEHYGKQSTV